MPVVIWAALVLGVFSAAEGAESLRFEVRETAGIRRFGYPVSWRFTLPRAGSAKTRFRLYQKDEVIPAQFRPVAADEDSKAWWLNMNVSLLPYEAREYRVEYGDDVPPASEPERGLTLERAEGEFRLANPPYLTFTVPEDLQGLLRSLKTRTAEFFEPDSLGLVLRSGQSVYPLVDANSTLPNLTARIAKQGPISNSLQFTGNRQLADRGRIKTTVDLEFVNTKSWVRVDWRIEDPDGVVTALGVDLKLALEPPSRAKPTLVDFGAGTLVYTTLRPGQSTRLEAGRDGRADGSGQPSWQVLLGPTDMLEPFVTSPRVEGLGSSAEGWAHVMDERRCTAVAVADFARASRDWIEISDEGRLQIGREFPAPLRSDTPGTKKLTFWLHFVPFPPHVGAATSPQSMLYPLELQALPAVEN